MSNQELEQGLREEWKNWQMNAHPDDRMSFIDYAGEVGTFKGHRVILVIAKLVVMFTDETFGF